MGGALRLSRALSGSLLSRLPASSSMLGLRVWPGAGPLGLALVAPDLVDEPRLRERPTEVIALLSLFTCGTRMKTGEEGRNDGTAFPLMMRGWPWR